MRGLDHVVAWAKARLEAVSDTREFALQDETGEWWTGALHKDWSVNEWRSMVGRVADLKSAYKQLPAHPAHAAVSVIAVKDDEGDMKFFRALSLMFGTTAAVYAFLRFSRALAFLAIHFLQLTVVEFFDDFSQVECHRVSESAQDSIEGLFSLLGWWARARPLECSRPSTAYRVPLSDVCRCVVPCLTACRMPRTACRLPRTACRMPRTACRMPRTACRVNLYANRVYLVRPHAAWGRGR